MTDLNHVIFSLSEALDLVGIDDVYHGKRVAYMALECAKELGYDEKTTNDLFQAAMIHDCGVSSSMVHEHLVYELNWEGAEDHCIRGFVMLSRCEKLKHLREYILYHHTYWNILETMDGDQDVYEIANLIFLVDRVDALRAEFAKENPGSDPVLSRFSVREKINEFDNVFFKSSLVEAFLKASEKESFWYRLENSSTIDYLKEYMGKNSETSVTITDLKDISKLFAYFVDAKSSYTAEHSVNVANLSSFLAQYMGLEQEVCDKVMIAGLLHDIGKLRIPDEIIEKKGPLNPNEYEFAKMHVFETEKILSKIEGLEEIAEWASEHHERLNGTGYPFRKLKGELSLPAKILAVSDIFQAYAQDRPYRRSLKSKDILDILKEKAKRSELDRTVVDCVEQNLDECYEIATKNVRLIIE